MDAEKTGILLINLGSPDTPEVPDVRKYLREFLGDPYVLDMPAFMRFILLNFIILPKRPSASSEAYKKIWTEEGSPLIQNTADLCNSLEVHTEKFMAGKYRIRYAMRYGNPSLQSAIEGFNSEGIKNIRILPLYPQYAAATTQTTVEYAKKLARAYPDLNLEFITSFYNHPGYFESFAQIIKEETSKFAREKGILFDHFIFSYHGLPEKAIHKADSTDKCLNTVGCCDSLTGWNSNCYRAQCFETTRLIADAMDIADHWWSVSFQSRMGRTPWIMPHTDRMILSMTRMGFRNIAIIAPSFVGDCLETLEELNIRGRELFLGSGGENFLFVPSLNSDERWVKGLTEILNL